MTIGRRDKAANRGRGGIYAVPSSPRRVPTRDEGNEWWPLPPDYPDLNPEAQRQARVNACCMRDTPEDFVGAWSFFREVYLRPTPEGFFYKRFKPSPPAHYQMIEDIGRYPRSIHGAPRGSAKSTVITREQGLLLSLTRPYLNVLDVFSVGRLVRRHLGVMMDQFTQNEYILRDFGYMKPKKGSNKQWSLRDGIADLANGASIECATVEGRKRGARPDFIFLDDPEYDKKDKVSETELSKQLEVLLFQELLPMFDTVEQTFEWVGTIVSQRSAIARAVSGEDPRFRYWNRRIYAADRVDEETGKTVYFWQEKFDDEFLASRRAILGDDAYEAEFRNNPVSSDRTAFDLDEKFNIYYVVGNEVVSYLPPSGDRQTQDYDKWINSLWRLITVDVIHKPGPSSDFAAALVIGIDELKTWWVLDLFMGRVSHNRFLREVMRLGDKWRPGLIGVEDAAGQAFFASWLESVSDQQRPWMPRSIFPIPTPPRLSKEDKIMTLEPRINQRRIKFPGHLRTTWPMRELFSQIIRFTPDGSSLSYDDAIDCLAMVNYCPRYTLGGQRDVGLGPQTAYDMLRQGMTNDPRTGLPILYGFNISDIPPDIMDKFLDKQRIIGETTGATPRTSSLMRRDRFAR